MCPVFRRVGKQEKVGMSVGRPAKTTTPKAEASLFVSCRAHFINEYILAREAAEAADVISGRVLRDTPPIVSCHTD